VRLARVLVLVGAVFAAAAAPGATAAATTTPEFQVVVHPSVKGTWISRASLQALFTGQTDRWGDKAVAKPVDQSMKTPVRRAFTTNVLGLSVGEIQRLWQARVAAQRIFPPPIKSSDAEVLAFVAGTTGAVGYVGPDTAIPEGVKLISLVD
jgi:ABC-type phosphate transport system substrate-binding protein